MANDFCEKNEQKDESGRKKKSGLKFAVLCASAILLFACAEAEKEAAQSPRVADGVQLSGVTALEISSDGKYMLSGSADGLLRVWDIYTGKQLEIVKAGDKPAFSAAFSAQDGVQNPEGGARAVISGGARILTGGQDGSVLMSLAATGEEIARYVGFGQSAEDNEWICITAAGYFVTSKKGSALLTVQAGGEELTMDQFRESLHRPDLVAQILRGEELSAPQPESGEKSAPQDGVTLAALLREADKLPLIEIVGAVKRTSAESSEKVQVRITDRGQGVGKIMIYNGDLCSGLPGLDEVMTGRRESGGVVVYDAALTIDLKPGRNPIAISVFGSREHGAPESKKAKMEISTSWQPPAPVETRPVLHVFTTAIQKYAAEKLNLKYTKADAAALQKSLARQGTTGSRYAKVELYSLYDEEVTKEGLTRKFNEIKPRVRERDTFVFFFSGHGAVDDYKDFYFLPADADGWTIAPERTILKHDLLGNLLKIKAQNIFVMLDTCQSGALRNMTSAVDRVWTDLGQQANLAILMAAAGNQYAIESEEDAQGVLTWSVLRSLEGQAQRREERYVAASEMLEYVRRDAPVKAEQVVAKVIQERLRSGRADEPVSTPLGEVAVKGFFDAASLAQEPAVKPPEKNFDLFDLKWRPAKVTLSARTAGELTIKGEGPVQKVSLDANKPKTVSLRDGAYEFAMLYKAAAPPETIRKDIVNETEVTIAFVNTAEVKRPITAPAGFVHVKPGSFLMGSPAAEEGRNPNEVQHEVRLSGFFMSKYEVTQKEYSALMRTNPGRFKADSNPVEQVSWFDAVRYCNEKSRREGLTPAYTINGSAVTWNRAASGYRLPTEAEWEYACRAGNTGPFSVSRANFNRNLRKPGSATNPVGSIDAINSWGLHDMQGNVWEWCWDWFAAYGAGPQTDPAGPRTGTLRAVRGGGYYASNEQLRSAFRGSDPPDYKDDSLGFRLARNIQQ